MVVVRRSPVAAKVNTTPQRSIQSNNVDASPFATDSIISELDRGMLTVSNAVDIVSQVSYPCSAKPSPAQYVAQNLEFATQVDFQRDDSSCSEASTGNFFELYYSES